MKTSVYLKAAELLEENPLYAGGYSCNAVKSACGHIDGNPCPAEVVLYGRYFSPNEEPVVNGSGHCVAWLANSKWADSMSDGQLHNWRLNALLFMHWMTVSP